MNAEALQDLEIEEEDTDEDSYIEYNLTSYPTDFTLSVLYDQWQSGDILVPDFQRGYVWNIEQASRLIESFLIGLPIPQVFLYVDDDQKLLVVDGQQRITSIAYFFEGYFGKEAESGTRKVFRLTGLQSSSPFWNKTYDELDASAQRKLKSSPLRAINIRQLKPDTGHTSVFQIFERLNTGGTPLKSQEIRNAIYRGLFNDTLKTFNANENWRALLGKKAFDKHMRDVELLLRVFALTYYREQYDGKMRNHLNNAMEENRDGRTVEVRDFVRKFPTAVELLASSLPPDPFRRRGPINSAMLEAVLCACLASDVSAKNKEELRQKFGELLSDPTFQSAISQSTNSTERATQRFDKAKEYLFS